MTRNEIVAVIWKLEEIDAGIDDLLQCKDYRDLGQSETTIAIILLQNELVDHVAHEALKIGYDVDLKKLRRENAKISNPERSSGSGPRPTKAVVRRAKRRTKP